MSPYRSATVAILIGLALVFVTMGFHPTGADVTRSAEHGSGNTFVTALHALALIAQPLILCGMVAFTAMLGFARALAVGGLVFFVMSSFAVLVAAAASGFVAPAVVRGVASADDVGRASIMGALRYTGQLNQAFASIHVLLSCIAMLMWSSEAARHVALPRYVPLIGFVVALGLLLGRASGHLSLGIHGYTLVVASQGLWFAAVAVALWRHART